MCGETPLETSAKFRGWHWGGTTDCTDGADENIPPLELIRAIREIRGELLPYPGKRGFRRGLHLWFK